MPRYVREQKLDRAITHRVLQLDLWMGFAGADAAIGALLLMGLGAVAWLALMTSSNRAASIFIGALGVVLFFVGFKIARSVARYEKSFFQDVVHHFEWRGLGHIGFAYQALKGLGIACEHVRLVIMIPIRFVLDLGVYIIADIFRSVSILVAIAITIALGSLSMHGIPVSDRLNAIVASAVKYGRGLCLAELAIIIAFAQILASSIWQVRQILDARISTSAEHLKDSCLALRESIKTGSTRGEPAFDEFVRKQIEPISELLKMLIQGRANLTASGGGRVSWLGREIHDSIAIQYVHDELFEEIEAYSTLLQYDRWLSRRATFGWVIIGSIAAFTAGLALLPDIPTWALIVSVLLTLVTAAQAARRQLDI